LLDQDEKLLPEAFRSFIIDAAERLQCPADFSAAAAVTFSGGVLGRRIGIRPKRHDDWLVVPNLWGAAVGRPGVMKTPAIAQAQTFLSRLEADARKVFQTLSKEVTSGQELAELRKQATRSMVKQKLKEGSDEEAERLIKELPQEEDKPIRERFILNDVTVEKLGEIQSTTQVRGIRQLCQLKASQ
jgi:putative DNA primase/helicase